MSRKLCSLCLAVAVFISTLSIAYADDMARVEVTEGDYALAVAALADAGLGTGFVSGRASTQRLYESGLPAGGQDASLNELQFLALDEMEAEALSRQAQREQLAANLALLDQYDGVKLASSATVYSDAGSTDSGHTIDSGKVARLEDIDATGRWYLVSFSSFSGYISADVCTPVDYSEYDGTDAVRTQAEIDARAKASYSVSFGSGVVSGSSNLRSAIVDYAYSFLGTPYVYGGASRSGTDCSGLTMQLYAQYGISLHHGCAAQYYASQPVSRWELQPGDLVFFYSGLGHVGVYIGGGQFIHASDSGVVVASLYSSYWAGNYYGAGRILVD